MKIRKMKSNLDERQELKPNIMAVGLLFGDC